MVQVGKCLNNGNDKDLGKGKNQEICLKKKIPSVGISLEWRRENAVTPRFQAWIVVSLSKIRNAA